MNDDRLEEAVEKAAEVIDYAFGSGGPERHRRMRRERARQVARDAIEASELLAESGAVDVRLSRSTATGLMVMIRELNQAKVLSPDNPQSLETSAWLEEIEAAVGSALGDVGSRPDPVGGPHGR